MFPKEITQFLKRFQGSIRKRPGRQTKFGRGGKPTEHPELHLRACRLTGSRCPGCTASHQGRTGTGEPRHTLLKKGIVYYIFRLYVQFPTNASFLLGMSKITERCEGRVSYSRQEVCSCYPALWGSTLQSKNPHTPKIAPSSFTQKLLFVTVLCVIALALLPHSCLPFLASFFFFFFPGYQVHQRDSDQYKTALFVKTIPY